MTTDLSLNDLADQINAEHREVIGALGHAIKHAMNAGDKLEIAKHRLPHGDWMSWIEVNCEISGRTARLYMQLAKERKRIEANWQPIANLSLQDVVSWLAPKLEAPSPKPSADFSKMTFEQGVAAYFHRSVWWVRHCIALAELPEEQREARMKGYRARYKLKWAKLKAKLKDCATIEEAEVHRQRARFMLAAIKFDAIRIKREVEHLKAISDNSWRLPNGWQWREKPMLRRI